jgi:uncharacterized protein
MKSRVTDPRHLEVEAFAQESVRLEGRWPQDELLRLKQSTLPESRADVAWVAQGESREARGGAAENWLHLTAETTVILQCQRCLSAMTAPLAIESSFQFVAGEDAAAALDADSEHDVLALTRELDLLTLVEDELLLALPIVPRHEHCPQPLAVPVSEEEVAAEKEAHPFAALAALKRGQLPN